MDFSVDLTCIAQSVHYFKLVYPSGFIFLENWGCDHKRGSIPLLKAQVYLKEQEDKCNIINAAKLQSSAFCSDVHWVTGKLVMLSAQLHTCPCVSYVHTCVHTCDFKFHYVT